MMLLDILTFVIVGIAVCVVGRRYIRKAQKKSIGCADKGMCSKCNMCSPDK